MDLRRYTYFLAFIILISIHGSSAIKCRECDGTEDCANKPDKEKDCGNEVKECFSSVDENGKFKRGCADASFKCDEDSCLKCSQDLCNTENFYCKKCDSTKDVECVTWTNEKSIKNRLCPTGITSCTMKIDQKNTIRDCVTKNEEKCASDTQCSICNTSGCNSGIFPPNRLLCYQCKDTNTNCAKPAKNPADILAVPCKLYEPSDKCFYYGKSATSMIRGCVSDQTEYTACSSTAKCGECSTDKCNAIEFEVTQSLKCIQCKSNNASCSWSFGASDGTTCEKKIEYWQPEGCYTKKVEPGKTERGCLNDVSCTSADNCASCKTDTCNRESDNEFECYVCRSTDNAKCAKKLEGESFPVQKCRNPVTAANKGCYIENWDGIIIRSCLADADPKTRKQCTTAGNKLCSVCTEVKCNSGDAPSSASTIFFGTGLMVLTLLILKFI